MLFNVRSRVFYLLNENRRFRMGEVRSSPSHTSREQCRTLPHSVRCLRSPRETRLYKTPSLSHYHTLKFLLFQFTCQKWASFEGRQRHPVETCSRHHLSAVTPSVREPWKSGDIKRAGGASLMANSASLTILPVYIPVNVNTENRKRTTFTFQKPYQQMVFDFLQS